MNLDGNVSLGIIGALIVFGIYLVRARKTLVNAVMASAAMVIILLVSELWGSAQHMAITQAATQATKHVFSIPLLSAALGQMITGVSLVVLLFLMTILIIVRAFKRRQRLGTLPLQPLSTCAKCGEKGYHLEYPVGRFGHKYPKSSVLSARDSK